ncbi:MAG: DUF4124 domain-containing protein [Gammaproteobacteria bacterium]|nr:DUF4124 domain-containing protein [Gammaproteobacteria bacterium]
MMVTALAAYLLFAGAAAPDGGHRLYRWVDQNGVVHFSDSLPAPAVARQREQLAPNGAVRRRLPPASPAAAASAAARAQAARQRADYDHFLLQTYDSAAALRAARDERLHLLDARLAQAQRQADQAAEAERSMRARLVAGAPHDAAAQRLEPYRRAAAAAASRVQTLRRERADTAAQFARDLARWQALQAAAAAPR